MEIIETTIQPTILHKKRLLVLYPDYMEYEVIDNKPIRFKKDQVKGLRFGINRIEGITHFSIGQNFFIEVQDMNGQKIQLKFISLYRINLKFISKKYNQILDTILKFYFEPKQKVFLEEFRSMGKFEFQNIEFLNEGIRFNKIRNLIPWKRLKIREFYNYCAFYDTNNPAEFVTFNYADDWNTEFLLSLVKKILKETEIE